MKRHNNSSKDMMIFMHNANQEGSISVVQIHVDRDQEDDEKPMTELKT